MVNPDWGIKRTCHACGAKYYDFKKKSPSCPSCGAALDPEALLKSRRRAAPEEKKVVPTKVEDVVVETDDEEDEAEDDSVLEDTEDLGGNDVEVEAEVEEEKEV